MELNEANRILLSTKAAIAADGFKLPSSAETDGLMMLLGRLDAEKFLAPKLKRARTEKSTAALERTIKYISFFRALGAVQTPLGGQVTAMNVMLLHKNLFGDLDKNAGKLRTCGLATDGNAHTDPKYISGSLKSIIAKMNEIPSAPQTPKDDFAGYLSHYMRELLILHPFDSGCEFTLRLFMMQLCKLKGFALSFHRVGALAVKNAETDTFATDDVTPMFRLFSECLAYDHNKQSAANAPRTRREVAKDLCRPARPDKPNMPDKPADVKPKHKQASANDTDVLKRAVRLQQKISKLTEQLTDLIRPLEDNDTTE